MIPHKGTNHPHFPGGNFGPLDWLDLQAEDVDHVGRGGSPLGSGAWVSEGCNDGGPVEKPV